MKVKAPFDGVIVDLPHYTTDIRVEQGKPVVSLMAYDKMYMDINLPESSIRYVKEAQPVYITHYTIPGDTLRGKISELSPAISSETRTYKGKVLVDNNQLKLRPGMFAKADIVVDRADSSIIIPKDVILSNRRRKYVYVVEKNTAKIRNLETGLEDEYNIEIISGLKVNDNLVVKGFETLKEDQGMSDVDDFDFICHIAFDKKPLTRKERAENVKKRDFLNKYSGAAREVLEALLDKYMNTGIYEIEKTEILKLDPFMRMGKPQKIASYFGGKDGYLKAVKELENAIYDGGAA